MSHPFPAQAGDETGADESLVQGLLKQAEADATRHRPHRRRRPPDPNDFVDFRQALEAARRRRRPPAADWRLARRDPALVALRAGAALGDALRARAGQIDLARHRPPDPPPPEPPRPAPRPRGGHAPGYLAAPPQRADRPFVVPRRAADLRRDRFQEPRPDRRRDPAAFDWD